MASDSSEVGDVTRADKSWLEDTEELCLRGNGHAMFTLGQYYLEKLKLNKAMEYFHAAAKQDDAQAYYQLAVAYYDGIGVDVDVVSSAVFLCYLC